MDGRPGGRVAERFDVTVRTLHHYDEVGLLVPSPRSASGYRLYSEADLTRLQHVVVYRRLGFALEDVAVLLDDPDPDVAGHLRRQRLAVTTRRDEMNDLVAAIDRALEAEMSGVHLTPEEQRELFGENFSDDDAQEAQERWGDTTAWAQSRDRTARYTKADWEEIAAESEGIVQAFLALKRAGEPAASPVAREVAERHRLSIDRRFYDCDHAMHVNLAEMYVSDDRYRRSYDDREPGLAQYIRDAVVASG